MPNDTTNEFVGSNGRGIIPIREFETTGQEPKEESKDSCLVAFEAWLERNDEALRCKSG